MAMHVSDLPLLAQAMYAELLDLSNLPALDAALAEAGTFSVKTVKGRRYWYFQPARRTSDRAAISQRYVGPESDELLQRIARHREAKRAEDAQRDRVRALVHAYGLPAPRPAVARVLDGLARNGVFRLNAVLIGAVAYQTYAGMLSARVRGGLAPTAIRNAAQFPSVSIVIQEQIESIKEILQAADPTLREIPLRRNPAIQYLSPNQLRVDILQLSLPTRQTSAEPSGFLEFLIRDPVKAVLLHGGGIAVTVPAPERFAIHELLVSRRRKATETNADSDLLQAAMLFRILMSKRPENLKRVWEEALQRGAAWRSRLLAGVRLLPASIQDELSGGEGEIRTHGARKGTPVFKTGALNRSATSPKGHGRSPRRRDFT